MSERKYKFQCDDDGHWYVIPVDLSNQFNDLLEDNETNRFYELFDKYRSTFPEAYCFNREDIEEIDD